MNQLVEYEWMKEVSNLSNEESLWEKNHNQLNVLIEKTIKEKIKFNLICDTHQSLQDAIKDIYFDTNILGISEQHYEQLFGKELTYIGLCFLVSISKLRKIFFEGAQKENFNEFVLYFDFALTIIEKQALIHENFESFIGFNKRAILKLITTSIYLEFFTKQNDFILDIYLRPSLFDKGSFFIILLINKYIFKIVLIKNKI